MEAVNLLPSYARPGHPWAAIGKDVSTRRVLRGSAAAVFVAVLGLGAGYVHERSVVNDKQASLADVQTQVAAADAKAAPLRTAQSAAAARMAAAGTVTASRVAWEALSRTSPGAAEPGLPAEPFGAVAHAARVRSLDAHHDHDHRRVGLLGDRRRVLARAGCARARPAGTAAVALECDACVEHERRLGRTTLSAGDTFSVTAGFNPNGGAK